jgi:Secretion system C-terminal sorting domain
MKNSCLIFAFFIAHTCCVGQNLIQNSGFETNQLDWQIGIEAVSKKITPDNYLKDSNSLKSPRAIGSLSLEISDEKQNRGTNSLQILAHEAASWTVHSTHFLPIKAGSVYELQAFVSVEKMKQQANMDLIFFDKNKNLVQKSEKTNFFLTGVDNWQIFVGEIIIPSEVAFAQIEISGKDSTEIWLDDLVLKKSELINKQGDFNIENDFISATLHLPDYSISLFDKKNKTTYTTLPVSGFITEDVISSLHELRLKSNFLTENMAIEFNFLLEENLLKIEIKPQNVAAPMFTDFEFPGAIPAQKAQYLVVPQHKSVFLPVNQPYPSYGFSLKNPQNTIGLVGVKGEKAAYFIATENPETAGFSFPENKDKLHEPQLWHSPENGLWGSKRTVYIGLTNNTYEEMTHWYQSFAQARGWAKPSVFETEKEPYIVNILPNPTFDIINLNFDTNLSEKTVLLIQDVNGKILLTETLESGMDSYRFDVDYFPSGLYQIHLFYTNGHQQSMRFLKTN